MTTPAADRDDLSRPRPLDQARLPPAGSLVVTDSALRTGTGPGPGPGSGPLPGQLPGSGPGGPGLRLRPWRPDDAPALVRGATDPEYRRWNTPKLLVGTEAQALEWIRQRAEDYERGTGCVLAVAPGGGGRAIGSVGLGVLDLWMRRGTVGYWVLPEARGQGVASGALDLFTRWAFGVVGLHRLSLGHAVGHDVSCRVAERCGFRYEGTLRGEMFEAGDTSCFRDAHLHARLATDPAPEPGAPA
ncbi:GNAT family N-acetyltransferase [Streptomyces sp. NBC_01497]|uniref:GNAT family N-acetyltransferase n=1 Tax=Streptomyces sp. NBC_01497 TaxID=2903885 RepID=UPI002E3106FF|nr:GNAT family N-acetyltransferase [Streptomyces sp. NBC_01497]